MRKREREKEKGMESEGDEPGRDKLMLQVTQLVACSINYADMRHQKADKRGREKEREKRVREAVVILRE